MQRLFFLVLISSISLHCNESKQPDQPQPAIITDSSTNSVTISSEPHQPGMSWPDSLVAGYINQLHQAAVQAARKDTSYLSWLSSDTRQTDTATYYVYQLGRSLDDRFATESWLYIDSARRTIFEYDIAEDKLTKWPKK